MLELAGAGQHLPQRAVQQPAEPVALPGPPAPPPARPAPAAAAPPAAGRAPASAGRTAPATAIAELLPRPLQQADRPSARRTGRRRNSTRTPPAARAAAAAPPSWTQWVTSAVLPAPPHAVTPTRRDLRVGGPPVQPGQFLGAPGEMLHRLRPRAPTAPGSRDGGAGCAVRRRAGRRPRETGHRSSRPAAGPARNDRRPGAGYRISVGAVGDLGPTGQDPRVVALGVRVPGHDRDMPRRAAGIDPGAGPVGDLPQDRGDPLVGEAEPDPDQVPVHQPGQDLRQLARVGAPVLGGGQHDAVRPVVLAVREQHRQLVRRRTRPRSATGQGPARPPRW